MQRKCFKLNLGRSVPAAQIYVYDIPEDMTDEEFDNLMKQSFIYPTETEAIKAYKDLLKKELHEIEEELEATKNKLVRETRDSDV